MNLTSNATSNLSLASPIGEARVEQLASELQQKGVVRLPSLVTTQQLEAMQRAIASGARCGQGHVRNDLQAPRRAHGQLEDCAERRLIEAGKLMPVIDGTYPLEQAREAMRHLQAGLARGKLVITISSAERA